MGEDRMGELIGSKKMPKDEDGHCGKSEEVAHTRNNYSMRP